MFGNGCACCIQRCPAFGPRVSLSSLAGLPEFMCTRLKHTYGAMSGSCKVYKESLSKTIREELEAKGVVIIPIPEKLRNIEKLGAKVCQQYALPAYADSVIILDTGHAKLMSPYFPLEELRSIEGMENVRFADPLGGGKGNSIRLTAISPRDNTLKAIGADNLFLAGERAGVLVGHTEAIVTGSLAGHNAALYAMGKGLKTIPASLAIGDIIDQSRVDCQGLPAVPGGFGLNASHTFSGSIYFKRMEDLGFYSPDPEVIHNKVKKLGLDDFFCA